MIETTIALERLECEQAPQQKKSALSETQIIKSYAFDDSIVYTARIRKKYILNDIETTPFTYKDGPFYNVFGFWIEDICNQFQMEFCPNCGNYKSYYSTINVKIECVC